MDLSPVYGCDGCAGTTGRHGCSTHGGLTLGFAEGLKEPSALTGTQPVATIVLNSADEVVRLRRRNEQLEQAFKDYQLVIERFVTDLGRLAERLRKAGL